jgi:hypothetical protein
MQKQSINAFMHDAAILSVNNDYDRHNIHLSFCIIVSIVTLTAYKLRLVTGG